MSLIDLSAAPGAAAAVAEKELNERIQASVLQQLLIIINENLPATVRPDQREAIEDFQMSGMAVAIEYVAQQTGLGDHPTIVTLRTQIVAEQIRRVKALEAAQKAAGDTVADKAL